MFWKIVPVKNSITLRLSIVLSALNTILFILLGSGLFWILNWQIQNEDLTSLTEFSTLIQNELKSNANAKKVVDKHLYDDLSVFQYHRYEILLLNAHKDIIFKSEKFPTGLSKHPNILFSSKYTGPLSPGHQLDINNQSYYVSIFKVPPEYGRQTSEYVIILLNTTQHHLFLNKLKNTLILIVFLGFLAFTLFGIRAVKKELKPLNQLSRLMKQISFDNLSQPLSNPVWAEELQEVTQTFDRLMERLSSGVRALNNFSSDLAHELKTPISTIRIETEVLLQQGRSCEDYEKCLRNNLEELERLSIIIDRLLLLARLDNQTHALDLNDINLKNLVEKLFSYYEVLALEKKIVIEFTGEGLIQGDETLIEMVIDNLLSNALKYSNSGSRITLKITASDAEKVTLIIQDTGRGISKTQLPYIFDRFYRADLSRSQRIPGNGLGLAITKAIMDAHHAEIIAESIVNEGSQFTLVFHRQLSSSFDRLSSP